MLKHRIFTCYGRACGLAAHKKWRLSYLEVLKCFGVESPVLKIKEAERMGLLKADGDGFIVARPQFFPGARK